MKQLLPAADSLDPQARAELLWTATATAGDIGDDQAALAARERPRPMLGSIQDRFLLAVCHLAMAWSAPIIGDFEAAVQEASVSLEQLHAQDEPFWTALTAFTAGSLETSAGRYDDALRHLREARDLAEGFEGTWLTAGSRVQLGILDVVAGRLTPARALLDEALNLSLTARSTPFVALNLAAYARLAIAEGDIERAALLEGAAEGLRRRGGLRAWPMLRRGEAELVGQVRQALGAAKFGEVFAAGTRLSQREAVSAVRDRRGTDATAPG